MTVLHVLLDSVSDVKQFVDITSRAPFDLDLISGHYTVDAKSIMGIFSLNLNEPIKLQIHSDCCPELLSELSPLTHNLPIAN